ncbi:NAD(P)-dependent oxidoreductase [Streptomyces chilikensis]|uniref:NAD(P)H-binding protein n=1 Tax=Streptomyces chilikensis TaxID=1194079 RepID=A0ABV3ELH4_9ACTN
MTRIAVFGANGTIGSAIVREALRRGHHVTAVVRDPAKVAERHVHLTVTTGDVLDPRSVTAAAKDQDVVVSAVGGGDGPGHLATILPAAEALTEGLRTLGAQAPRLITVGGAGSLRTSDGKQVWDAPGLPDFILQIMHAHGDALDHYRTVTDVDWTNISPAAKIAPGHRTGFYRTALDDLVTDEHGNSTISVEDYAVALLDEIERPRHHHQRFTVGY